MPATSIDTFFACSLMVLLVLSAMVGASKILYPYINSAVDENIIERYRQVSRYLLLNEGEPSNWGQNSSVIPHVLGLARVGCNESYELDIDKVSRLNSENLYGVSYAQMFTALGMPDVSFRIEIKPVFNVEVSLTAEVASENETMYQFEISTEKHGVPVQTALKCYTVAENYLSADYINAPEGKVSLNKTVSNSVKGPALLIVFAKASCNDNIASFTAYAFPHNSPEPKSKGTFLRLSPVNHTLNISFVRPETSVSNAYALSLNYNSTLAQIASNNESATYSLPHFLDSSPTLIVLTGYNSTSFFTEWTAYPQIPVQAGADFSGLVTLSSVFAYTYLVTVNSVIYECTVWIGGPKQ